jgi:uridine kinase
VKKTREIKPTTVSMIFVEGMFLFKIQKVRDLLDFKMFIEVDDDIRLSRMGIHKFIIFIVLYENKYMKTNPASLKSFFIIYEKYIKAAYEVHVEYSKKYANLILPNFNITPDDQIEDNPSLEFLLVNLKNIIRYNK